MGDTTRRRSFARLVFEPSWDDRDDFEAPARGYRSHVWVEFDDGQRHPLTFYDATRLSQEINDELAAGRGFFAEPGLIVLPEVTLTNIEAAVRALVAQGFFDAVSTG